MGLRVISLVPSATETLLAWGIMPIACTRFCEQPAIATVGGTKDPDVDAIVAARPDVVVVDEEENRREDADALAAARVPLHVMAVRSAVDVPRALEQLADRVGVRVDIPSFERDDDGGVLLRAFVPIWRRPWMTVNGDTYGSTLMRAAGIDNVYARDAARYPTIDLDDAAARRPDVVLAPSEPYPFGERQRAELERVAPVSFVDGKDLFWWGVRTAPALDRLRELSRLLAPGAC